jgi:hypothetical protein
MKLNEKNQEQKPLEPKCGHDYTFTGNLQGKEIGNFFYLSASGLTDCNIEL